MKSNRTLDSCVPPPLRPVRTALAVAGLFLAAALPLHADWPNTNATKWVQFPDRKTGYDVLAAPAAGTLPLILADDFPCRKAGLITDIHLWTSWLGDEPNQTLPITLGIWSDFPATNGVSFSHPDQLLWSQTFGPGQYSIKAWGTATEQFWNPDSGQILGPDNLIWQYNFYPTNPFAQQGSPANPIVYWLSVTAGTNTALFGWKTATNHWNDDAVVGHLDPQGSPLFDWKELRDPQDPTGLGRSLDLAFALTTRPDVPNPPPPPTNKWWQLPDLQTGLDVHASFPKIVADDFPCKEAGTITNIQIWASWQDNVTPNPNTVFVLSIWSDIPATTANPHSRPGSLLWTETFLPGSYLSGSAGTGNEQFYDPDNNQLAPESQIWRYSFTPKKPFCQKGSTNAPVVYWLAVSARPPAGYPPVGWKTSTNHWNDDAVYGHLNAAGAALNDWKELFDPRSGISLDLAFIINNGPPSADCDPRVNAKYVQWPDPSTNGLDVKATVPKILADDFPCRRPGRINGITVWGSWLQDRVDPNVTFQLGLWTDVPKQPGTTGYSHPGQLLCTQTFYPPSSTNNALPRYKAGLWQANVDEKFYDPNLPGLEGLIGSDTQIWRYDFYPTFPCWRQVGSPTAQRVYWLSLVANTSDTNAFLFGWKTTTNHWNDDAVFGHVTAAGGPLGDWVDLHDPRTNLSLDLSFALRAFPIVSVNKDLINKTPQPADGIRMVIAGIREITAHYDDAPPWPNFQATYLGGNTVLQWSGKTVPPGGLTHVGASLAGNTLQIVSMAWLQGPVVVGPPIQLNHRLLGNGTVLVLANNFVPDDIIPANGAVEYYADPVELHLLKPNVPRTPILTVPLPIQPAPVKPGGVMRIPLQQPAPPTARYALLHLMLKNAQGEDATEDFLLLPLDMELAPVIHDFQFMDSFFDVFFDATPDRSYEVLTAPTLDSFFDVFTELSVEGGDGHVQIPAGGPQKFLKVRLQPE
jgi:hypothetical protein